MTSLWETQTGAPDYLPYGWRSHWWPRPCPWDGGMLAMVMWNQLDRARCPLHSLCCRQAWAGNALLPFSWHRPNSPARFYWGDEAANARCHGAVDDILSANRYTHGGGQRGRQWSVHGCPVLWRWNVFLGLNPWFNHITQQSDDIACRLYVFFLFLLYILGELLVFMQRSAFTDISLKISTPGSELEQPPLSTE